MSIGDSAQGMSRERMDKILKQYGGYFSGDTSRGIQGRGARDVTELGVADFESIKDDMYVKYVMETNRRGDDSEATPVTSSQRKRMEVPKGQNGTVVTLNLATGKAKSVLPRFDNFIRDLSNHYALRLMLSKGSETKVLVRNVKSGKEERLIYKPPPAELVMDVEFEVEGYAGADVRLKIYRCDKPLPAHEDKRLRQYGMLVNSKRAVHELTLFGHKDDEISRHYYGVLECDYIDYLIRDWYNRLASGISPADDNPELVIDGNRQNGLTPDHKFTKALYAQCAPVLGKLLDEDRKKIKPSKNIADADTQVAFDQIAKDAVEIFAQLDELEDVIDSGPVKIDKDQVKQGIFFDPDDIKIKEGFTRKIKLRARRSVIGRDEVEFKITADPKRKVSIKSSKVKLTVDKDDDSYLIGTVTLVGVGLSKDVMLVAACDLAHVPEAIASVAVIKNYPIRGDHEFKSMLEFGRSKYKVAVDETKVINLFAKRPELIDEEITVPISKTGPNTDYHKNLKCTNKVTLEPVRSQNYAIGRIVVKGNVLFTKTTLTVQIGKSVATTTIQVVDKPDTDTFQIPLKVELSDEGDGKDPARWRDDINQPWTLQVSVNHPSLLPHFVAAEKKGGKMPKQSVLFRSCVAPIVADYLISKYVVEEARRLPRFIDTPQEVASTSLERRRRKAREQFVALAQRRMIPEKEAEQIREEHRESLQN
jgi:hypothetical protein